MRLSHLHALQQAALQKVEVMAMCCSLCSKGLAELAFSSSPLLFIIFQLFLHLLLLLPHLLRYMLPLQLQCLP